MGDKIKEFEFDEDQVVPYFREKIGRIVDKEDIPALLLRTGPLQAMRERGRNVYAYSDADKKTVDGWVRELIDEGRIGTVFLDEPHIMVSEEIPYYASATRKEKELTQEDRKVLECLSDEPLALSDITAKLEMDEDVTFRCMRKLESMYLATRVGVTGNNKWFFCRYKDGFQDQQVSCDRVITRFLDCFAPATLQEIAFALSMNESAVKASLEALIADEEIVRGRFLISENDQYMRKLDHMRLKAGKSNVFDFDTVERYRFHKCPKFKTIMEYFDYYESAGNELDVFNRVENFDLKEWYDLRKNGKILLGRFLRGKVRFVTAEMGDKLSCSVREAILPEDEQLLEKIRSMGTATMRQLVSETGGDKDKIKESILRLDKALKVVRAFDEKEDWGTENNYQVYEPRITGYDPVPELVEKVVRAYGPIPPMAVRYITGADPLEAVRIATEKGASTILVGDAQAQMLVMSDEIPNITKTTDEDREIRIYSLFDPDLGSKWAEISSRYGDRWIYPLVMDSRVVGALEVWEMSGCIEIRSMDMDDPSMLPDVLKSVDRFMRFFNMKGVEIVRIREILTKDAADLDENTKKILADNGYEFVNGFYAKGRFVAKSFNEHQILSYLFWKQRAVPGGRYQSVDQAMADRGYIRTDAEVLTRVADKTSMKRQMERGIYVKTTLLPPYVGFTTPENMRLFYSAKDPLEDENSETVLRIIRERQPVSRKELVACSPLSERATIECLNQLFHHTQIYMDSSSKYCAVEGERMDKYEALKEIVRMHFRSFGIFTADTLAQFIVSRMSVVRRILMDLEDEGMLVKGFLYKDDPTVVWMLKSDIDLPIRPLRNEIFLLNTQDNLHVYLRDIIKREAGATENVIFKGTRIIGSFKGKLTIAGAKVEDFKGSPEAKRYLKDLSLSLGVSIEDHKKEQEDKDWDLSEFFIKSNPGAI